MDQLEWVLGQLEEELHTVGKRWDEVPERSYESHPLNAAEWGGEHMCQAPEMLSSLARIAFCGKDVKDKKPWLGSLVFTVLC